MPVVLHDGPGFLVNRLLMPYMEDALTLLEEGQPMAAIERAARKFGMPMGPFELYDMVGLDTSLYAGKVLCEAYPGPFSGLADCPGHGGRGPLGPQVGTWVLRPSKSQVETAGGSRCRGGAAPFIHGDGTLVSEEQLTHRLFLPMLLEATRVLEEHRVRSAQDVDVAMIFGTGFPPFRGGLVFWGDQLGAAKVLELLQPWQDHGAAFQPTELLLRCAAEGKTLYELALTSGGRAA